MSYARLVIEAETPKKVFRQAVAAQASRFTDRELETFAGAYIEAALWSSHNYDDEGNLVDDNLEGYDLAPETTRAMINDCRDFLGSNYQLVHTNLRRAGMDFWLSRNGHGAGFFDGDWGDDGDKLQDIAGAYGSADLYVGDDGLVYQQ